MARMMRSGWFAFLVAVPPICAAFAWTGILAVAGITGHHPIWRLEPRNVAEAAAFRDGGALVRLVDRGEDVNRPAEVRAGVIRHEPAVLTPIEAAAAARQREMVQLLLDLGATPDALVWQRAFCISDARDVREVLASRRPPGAREECVDH